MKAHVAGRVVLAAVLALRAAPAPAADKPPVPDLTQGGQPDKSHDGTLGPTVARGWVRAWRGWTCSPGCGSARGWTWPWS